MLGDLEKLPFASHAFDGIIASSSLLHMPKSELPKVLRDIKRTLRDKGIFYVSMKEGHFEGWVESKKYPDGKGFFSLYSEDELKDYLKDNFEVIHHHCNILGDSTFLVYLCRAKSLETFLN